MTTSMALNYFLSSSGRDLHSDAKALAQGMNHGEVSRMEPDSFFSSLIFEPKKRGRDLWVTEIRRTTIFYSISTNTENTGP